MLTPVEKTWIKPLGIVAQELSSPSGVINWLLVQIKLIPSLGGSLKIRDSSLKFGDSQCGVWPFPPSSTCPSQIIKYRDFHQDHRKFKRFFFFFFFLQTTLKFWFSGAPEVTSEHFKERSLLPYPEFPAPWTPWPQSPSRKYLVGALQEHPAPPTHFIFKSHLSLNTPGENKHLGHICVFGLGLKTALIPSLLLT